MPDWLRSLLLETDEELEQAQRAAQHGTTRCRVFLDLRGVSELTHVTRRRHEVLIGQSVAIAIPIKQEIPLPDGLQLLAHVGHELRRTRLRYSPTTVADVAARVIPPIRYSARRDAYLSLRPWTAVVQAVRVDGCGRGLLNGPGVPIAGVEHGHKGALW